MEMIRLGHAHTSRCEPEQSIDLSVLPSFFLCFASISSTFFHGSGTTAIFYLATFSVIGALAKTALVGFFVYLGATDFCAAANHISRCFFATLLGSSDFIDEAFLDQWFHSFGSFHRANTTLILRGSSKNNSYFTCSMVLEMTASIISIPVFFVIFLTNNNL